MRIVFGADDENETTRAVREFLATRGEVDVLAASSWPELGAAAGVLTAGIGAAAAALRDRATAERNVIYPVGAR